VLILSQNQKLNYRFTQIQLATFINFSTVSTEATKVIAYDMTGKVVATEVIEMGKAKMNTSNMASGAYMYQVTDKENQILTTGKFNVSK
jgi:hypothetical protein